MVIHSRLHVLDGSQMQITHPIILCRIPYDFFGLPPLVRKSLDQHRNSRHSRKTVVMISSMRRILRGAFLFHHPVLLVRKVGTGGANGTFHVFDNVVITAVPEPSAALIGGLGLLALLRRRR